MESVLFVGYKFNEEELSSAQEKELVKQGFESYTLNTDGTVFIGKRFTRVRGENAAESIWCALPQLACAFQKVEDLTKANKAFSKRVQKEGKFLDLWQINNG